MDDSNDRFDFLFSNAEEFCRAMGLQDDLLRDIYRSDSDWAFILKVDSLLEVAMRRIVSDSLKMEIKGRVVGRKGVENFVATLPVSGKTSLLKLVRVSGCPKDLCDFIESTRKLRNAFAHNIKLIDEKLLTVILDRDDSSSLLKNLSSVEKYEEADLISRLDQDGDLLRFGILDSMLRFLTIAYHVTIKPS